MVPQPALAVPDDVPPLRIALVNMPFGAADRPSIQCGLLKAGLVRAGHEVDIHYLNLHLAAQLGSDVYAQIANIRTDQFMGEWLFTVSAFGYKPDEQDYRRACPTLDETLERIGYTFEKLCRLRNEILPATIGRWLDEIDWSRYAVIGFTSTFEQNVPALAMSRHIKQAHPEPLLVFGGANFDGEMGPAHIRAFDWIDCVVSGEGDEVLPALVARVARREPLAGLPGVCYRDEGQIVEGGHAPKIHRMDALPDPDYDEYFATLYALGREKVLGVREPLLLFESARGCWWGEKHHCTFCGLNASGMAFRSKSPQRVLDELRRLSGKYKIVNFESVDNIMDVRYLREVSGPLAERNYDYSLFYEVKANLTREQLRAMARAGINEIQPGIESLSTHVLKLMRKGTTMLQNVRLLKWAHYYGIRVGWQIITGFPGETIEDYEAQAEATRLLWHLPAPGGVGRIWLERFSPYFFDPSFPVSNVRPREVYSHIYPEELDLRKAAYFFDYEMGDVVSDADLAPFHNTVAEWIEAWYSRPQPFLAYQRAPDWIQVMDRRVRNSPRAHLIKGVDADIYELCGDREHTPERVAELLESEHGVDLDPAAVEKVLLRFRELGLVLEENGRYLSLATPVNGFW